MREELQLSLAVPSTTSICRIPGMKEDQKETPLKLHGGVGKSTIAVLREAKGMNQSELARAVGVSPQAVQKWEGGTSTPRPSKIADIAEALGVEKAALMAAVFGATGIPGAIAGAALGILGGAIPSAATTGSATLGGLKLFADDGELEVDRIPYWDAKGSCGGGFLNYEDLPKGHLVKEIGFFKKYHLKPENAIAVYADGNSMANFIVDGDIVIFDKSRTDPRSGKIFLIDHPDGLRIKQLRREIGGAWVLESLNPDKTKYPDERIEPAQGSLLKIYGEFVYRQGG